MEWDKLMEIQKLLEAISEKMQALEDDIDATALYIREKKLIDGELSDRIGERLRELITAQEEYRSLFREAGLGEAPEELKAGRAAAAQAAESLKIKERLEKYKEFLGLRSEDPETEKLLNKKKQELQERLIRLPEDREGELKPYTEFARMISLMAKQDSAETMGCLSLNMTEFVRIFGHELLGKAIVDRTVRTEPAQVREEAGGKEKTPENLPGEGNREEAGAEFQRGGEADGPEGFRAELAQMGLLTQPDVLKGRLYTYISEAETKKVSTKKFLHDMRTEYPPGIARVMKCIDRHTAITASSVAMLTNMMPDKLVLPLEYLKNKGYIREYGIPGLMYFYCSSPKAYQALQARESRAFLKIRGTGEREPAEIVEARTSCVLTRMAYAGWMETCLEHLNCNMLLMPDVVGEEYFVFRAANQARDRFYLFAGAFWEKAEEVKEYLDRLEQCCADGYVSFVVAGMNRERAEKAAEFLRRRLEQDPEKMYCYGLLENVLTDYSGAVVSRDVLFKENSEEQEGTSGEDAEEPAESGEPEEERPSGENAEEPAESGEPEEERPSGENAEEPAESEEPEEERLSGEDAEEPAESGEPEEIERLSGEDAEEPEEIEQPSGQAAEEIPEKEERITGQDPEETTESGEPEKKSSDRPEREKDVSFSRPEKGEKEEPEEPDEREEKDEIHLENIYRMIEEEKIYCAVTYLRSVTDGSGAMRELYDKLAYAVNDPWRHCAYSSQKIFSLYGGGENLFTKYLMTAAALRNFFLNHVCYDYDMKALYANVRETEVVNRSAALTNVLYNLMVFKDRIHKGMDFYADYRVKDQMAVERKLEALSREARSYYDSYVTGRIKESARLKRFVETERLIFAQSGDFAGYLKAVADKEYELAGLVKAFVEETFISGNCSVEDSNIDSGKLNKYVDEYWDRAGENMLVARKTSDLMSRLRNNLLNALEKIIHVMCQWVSLVEEANTRKDDEGSGYYRELRRDILEDMKRAGEEQRAGRESMGREEKAGSVVLEKTLQEFISRLDGSYDEKSHKYFYIDFLRGNDVLLEDNYFPDTRGSFGDFRELSLTNRICRHSQAQLMSFEERLDCIFNRYGDDYGSAELIVGYLEETGEASGTEKYNIRKSEEMAEAEARLKLDDFIENLELAQSYGQIEETKENKKEKIQKIASEWFEYARESRNYGFFHMVLGQYRKKIHEDAKVRGRALLRELEQLKELGGMERKQNRIQKIRQMIEDQNYTVAEDLLARIHNEESEEEIETTGTDYLKKFIDEYDYNYKIVADSSRKLSDLISSRMRNKDEKGARRLVDNWMSNGQPLGQRRLGGLLEAVGFAGADIREQTPVGKIENYLVTVKMASGGNINYRHPIAAFGSKAGEEGFRVACLFGRYDADRLIEEFKNIGGTKNTLVLLDYALPLAERRRLARKVKSDLNDKVFAVLDRVLLMFLVNSYNTQFINQILMSVMMPYAYYQPYVWDSAKVMPPEMFMGRKEELEKIESPAGVNIVYGGRQLGKSALLKMAKRNIDGNGNHDRAVLVEIKGLDHERAARKIGHELYDAGIIAEDVDTTDWDELARVIKRRLQDRTLPEIPYLLLLLDEADAFIESCEKVNFQPFDALKEIQSLGMDRFKFVIAGLHNIVRFKRDAALSNNSVLTHLTSITVKPFDQREARLLLEGPLYYLGFRFPRDRQSLVSLILANTNYFPGLIQLYCANLIEAMRKSDYAGYDQVDSPVYEMKESHIKKVLSDAGFMEQIREKFEITLKLDEDNLYHIIALLMAYLYHQNTNSASESEGFSAGDIIDAGREYGVKKIADLSEEVVDGLMMELTDLNILRQTVRKVYLFSRYSFFQMMGKSNEVEDKLLEYMEG